MFLIVAALQSCPAALCLSSGRLLPMAELHSALFTGWAAAEAPADKLASFLRVSACTIDFLRLNTKEAAAWKNSQFNSIPLHNTLWEEVLPSVLGIVSGLLTRKEYVPASRGKWRRSESYTLVTAPWVHQCAPGRATFNVLTCNSHQ